MKRFFAIIVVLLSLTLLVSSCELLGSLFGKVEEADVRDAVEDIMSAAVATKDTATAELVSASLFRYSSADGTFVVEVDFSNPSVAVSTSTFAEYVLPSSGYSVTGSLVGSVDMTSTTLSVPTTGTLELDGGRIKTLEYDLLVVGTTDGTAYWVTATVTGRVTANRTEFDVVGWSLGSLHIANSNALAPFIIELMS